MRPVVSADLRFVTTPTGALAAVESSGAVTVAPVDGLSRLAKAGTGFAWSQGVGEVLAERGVDTLAVSSPVARPDAGTLTVTRGERVVLTATGDLAVVLRAASAWGEGGGA